MKTIKVMISGTIDDMQSERKIARKELLNKSVAKALKRLRVKPICAETEQSEDRSSRDKVISMVRECDIYIGLYNHTRYGYSIAGSDISVTQLEFQEAKKQRM